MISRIKNIFFILPFVMHTVFAFDGYSGDEGFGIDLSIEQGGGDSTRFLYGDGEGFVHPLQEEQGATSGSIEDQFFLSFLNDSGAPELEVAQRICAELACQQESDGSSHSSSSSSSSSASISDSSGSSSSSFNSSGNEYRNTIEGFVAAVNRLARIEEGGGAYKCPILGCEISAKVKSGLEVHLRFHNASFVVCIFCKKELYSQDITDSHHCKCPFCDVKCRKRGNVIEFMTQHVRKQHHQLATEFGMAPINEELGDRSFASSLDSSSSSSLTIQVEKVGSKIIYTCDPCAYSTYRKADMSKHVYFKHFDMDGPWCVLCYKKIYTFDKDHLCRNYRKKRSVIQFAQAYLDAYPQFDEPTYKELPEIRTVKKGASTHYTCPYCDSWSHTSTSELSYHIYCCHTLARKETCLACGKPMYMKGDLERHSGECPDGASVSGSSSSSSSSLLALTATLSASNGKRGCPSSPDVRKDAEADRDKRLCTPSLQPVSPEQWNRSSHEECRPLDFSGSEAFGGQCSDDSSDYSCDGDQFDDELFPLSF